MTEEGNYSLWTAPIGLPPPLIFLEGVTVEDVVRKVAALDLKPEPDPPQHNCIINDKGYRPRIPYR